MNDPKPKTHCPSCNASAGIGGWECGNDVCWKCWYGFTEDQKQDAISRIAFREGRLNLKTLTPEQKLQYLEDCICAIKGGLPKVIVCPYCGAKNSEHRVYLCCNMFADATEAICNRLEKQEAVDFFSNVADKAMVN